MTRLERLQEGQGVADDALGLIRGPLKHDRLPSPESVEMCIALLGAAMATLRGALTLPIEDPPSKQAALPAEHGPPHEGREKPPDDFWWKRD